MAADQSTEATRALGRSLTDTFGRGWATGDMNLLMTVYAPDAVFIETPFTAPLQGTDAIRGYWNEVPYHQSDITFSSGEIYAAGPWFSTEFKWVFRRRRTGEWVEAQEQFSVRPSRPDHRNADVLASPGTVGEKLQLHEKRTLFLISNS